MDGQEALRRLERYIEDERPWPDDSDGFKGSALRDIADALSYDYDRFLDTLTPTGLLGLGYVALPKDAEGEPIHIGDVMETPDGETFEVSGIFYGAHEVMVDSVRFDYDPDEIIHHHAPTVEDVLREFAEKVTDSQIPGVHPTHEEAIAEYAAKLRLAGEDA